MVFSSLLFYFSSFEFENWSQPDKPQPKPERLMDRFMKEGAKRVDQHQDFVIGEINCGAADGPKL